MLGIFIGKNVIIKNQISVGHNSLIRMGKKIIKDIPS